MPHPEIPMEEVLRTGDSARDLEAIVEQLTVCGWWSLSTLFLGLSAQKQAEKDRESLREELWQSQKLLRDEREKRLIDGAIQSAERAKTLVKRLLAFACPQRLWLHPINVGEMLTGLTDHLWRHLAHGASSRRRGIW